MGACLGVLACERPACSASEGPDCVEGCLGAVGTGKRGSEQSVSTLDTDNSAHTQESCGGKRSPTCFTSRYAMGPMLGTGALATVHRAWRKTDGQAVAVKVVPKHILHPTEESALLDEVNILAQLHHPNVVRLEEWMEDSVNFYIVLELVQGGELLERLADKDVYGEGEARGLLRCLLKTLVYLHDRDVVHRDLKLENLLMIGEEDDSTIKVCDFGLAVRTSGEGGLATLDKRCGSPGYMAPELLRGESYGKAVDLWAVGVILYTLLGGHPPFFHRQQSEMHDRAMRGDYDFHKRGWTGVSWEAKDLITKLLCQCPRSRLSATQALRHPWLQLQDGLVIGVSRGVRAGFHPRRKLRATIRSVMAVHKFQKAMAVRRSQ